MTRPYLILVLLLCSFFVQAQEWEAMNDTPFFARHHCNGYAVDDVAYVLMGGSNSQDYSNNFYLYDGPTDAWTQLDDFPGEQRGFGIGDDWDGKYYYGFGNGPSGRLNDLWVFDPADMSWTELPSCPGVGRAHPAFVAQNDKVFVGTGSANGTDLDDWWVYDMITEQWTEQADMPGGNRHHPFQFGIGDFVYVGGGHVFNWEKFSITTEEWSPIDSYPEGRVAGTQFHYNGKGYTLSGDNYVHGPIGPGNRFLEYDPATDEWETLPTHPGTNRWACSSFVMNGYVYLFAGWDFSGPYDSSMWRYQLEEIEEPSAAQDVITDSNIQVSPNPFSTEVYVDFGGENAADYTFEVFNLLGELVRTSKLAGSQTVDLSDLTEGVYLMSFRSENELITRKVVKK